MNPATLTAITGLGTVLSVIIAMWTMLAHFDKRNTDRFEGVQRQFDALEKRFDALEKHIESSKEVLRAEAKTMSAELRLEMKQMRTELVLAIHEGDRRISAT